MGRVRDTPKGPRPAAPAVRAHAGGRPGRTGPIPAETARRCLAGRAAAPLRRPTAAAGSGLPDTGRRGSPSPREKSKDK